VTSAPATPRPESPLPESPAPVPGRRSLWRRISGRAIDLAVIGIVLATSLSVGQQLIQWWHDDTGLVAPQPPVGIDLPAWDGHDGPLLVEFGQFPVVMRQELVTGSLETAQEALSRDLAQTLKGPEQVAPIAANERRILDLVSELPPPVVWTREGIVTEFQEQLLGALAIRLGPGTTLRDQIRTGRLTAWGFLWPAPDNAWRLYRFERTSPDPSTDPLRLAGPAQAVRLLGVGQPDSGQLLAFRGTGTLGDWQAEFERELTGKGWARLGDWQGQADSRGVQFSRATPQGRELADLRLVRDNSGTMYAMVQWLQQRPETPARETR